MTAKFAHMCQDGHLPIGHNDSEDGEMCCVCRLLYALDWISDQQPLLVDAAIERFEINPRVLGRDQLQAKEN